jgi:DNA-directed RNA polymerase specialized sigma24 family protein
MMKTQTSDRTIAQLSHQELVRLLAANPQNRLAAREFISRYDMIIRQTVAHAIHKRYIVVRPEFIQNMIEDAVNDTYCRLFQRDCQALKAFHCRYENSIFAYLQSICLNMIRNQDRNDRRRPCLAQMQSIELVDEKSGKRLAEGGSVGSRANGGETEKAEFKIQEQMIRADFIHSFRATQANRNFIIFKLHFVYGYRFHEIACIKSLGLGESGVGNTANRIRHWLREQYARSEKGKRLTRQDDVWRKSKCQRAKASRGKVTPIGLG